MRIEHAVNILNIVRWLLGQGGKFVFDTPKVYTPRQLSEDNRPIVEQETFRATSYSFEGKMK